MEVANPYSSSFSTRMFFPKPFCGCFVYLSNTPYCHILSFRLSYRNVMEVANPYSSSFSTRMFFPKPYSSSFVTRMYFPKSTHTRPRFQRGCFSQIKPTPAFAEAATRGQAHPRRGFSKIQRVRIFRLLFLGTHLPVLSF